MKKLALFLALIGIFILLTILNYSSPLPINSSKNISSININQKISLSGKVTSQTSAKLIIDKNLEVYCGCSSKNYLNKNVSILGVMGEYYGEKIINALIIKIN
ncbi:MAG: hypothetical protein Q8L29_01810 [archaeon]|nr:hypothetical protein [archaeon]